MNKTKFDLCKDSFEYFLYEIRNQKNKASGLQGSNISASALFSDNSIENCLSMYKEIIVGDKKLTLIKEHQRKMGVSVFLCLFMYYNCVFNRKTMFYISKTATLPMKLISELALILRPLTLTEIDSNVNTKMTSFPKNNSTIRFLSDGTYEFRAFKEPIDLVVFDNAALQNYEKLSFFLESSDIAEGVILNFNHDKSEKEKKDIDRLEIEFKDRLNIIEKLTSKTII